MKLANLSVAACGSIHPILTVLQYINLHHEKGQEVVMCTDTSTTIVANAMLAGLLHAIHNSK